MITFIYMYIDLGAKRRLTIVDALEEFPEVYFSGKPRK